MPVKVLLRYAKSLPKDASVTLSASAEESSATLQSHKSTVTLRCYPPGNFPALPAFAREGAFSVPAKALAASVGRVLPFASTHESRPVLTGVLVEFAEDSARMVHGLLPSGARGGGPDRRLRGRGLRRAAVPRPQGGRPPGGPGH